MTDDIDIKPGLIVNHGWEFAVSFHGRHYTVTVSQPYWRKLTHGDISPMAVLLLAIEYAIDQSVADVLPEQFSLEDLAQRLPDFDKHIRREANTEAATNPR